MDTQSHLQRLEDRLTYMEAIIDGSEAQTREAVAYVVAIVTRYFHEQGLIDAAALRRYVATFDGDTSNTENYVGDLVRHFGEMLDFQERHPAEFRLPLEP